MTVKVIIAGGRDFNNKALLEKKMSFYFQNIEINEVVCGCAKGADTLGRDWAEDKDIPVELFPADWDKHGKAAGYIRNKQMAEYATHLIAFWDGESRGTKHMIDLAKEYGLEIRIVKY